MGRNGAKWGEIGWGGMGWSAVEWGGVGWSGEEQGGTGRNEGKWGEMGGNGVGWVGWSGGLWTHVGQPDSPVPLHHRLHLRQGAVIVAAELEAQRPIGRHHRHPHQLQNPKRRSGLWWWERGFY